jgi:hypothetical protein
MGNPLFESYLRIARAEEHFVSLTEVLKGYKDNISYDILSIAEFHPTTFEPDMTKIRHAWPDIQFVPDMANVYTGEVVQNLRTALDYFVFALARSDSQGVEQTGTQFLIEDDPGNAAKRWGFTYNAPRRLKGFKQAHIDLIENLQPYKGCYWSRRLRDLSNPDKHRKLYAPIVAGRADWSFSSEIPRPDRVGWPCRVLEARGPGGSDVYMYLRTSFDVLFEDDSGLALPIEPILKELLTEIPRTLELFEPCVDGICGH